MIDWFTLMELAKCGYIKNNNLPDEWYQIGKTDINKETGFVGKVFRNNEGEIVISFSGTDLKDKGRTDDLRNDLNMAIGNLPPQFENAKELYIKTKLQYSKSKITLTGESLGGSLAALVGVATGETTVTFAAYGIGDLIPENKNGYPNITNIGDTRDPVFMSNVNNHLGKTYVIPYKSKIYIPVMGRVFTNHGISHMGPLLDIQEYKKGSIKSYTEKMDSGKNAYLRGVGVMNTLVGLGNQFYDKYGKPVIKHTKETFRIFSIFYAVLHHRMDLRSISGSGRVPLGIFQQRRTLRPLLHRIRSRGDRTHPLSVEAEGEAHLYRKDPGDTASGLHRDRTHHHSYRAGGKLYHGIHPRGVALGLPPFCLQLRRAHRTQSEYPLWDRRHGLPVWPSAVV